MASTFFVNTTYESFIGDIASGFNFILSESIQHLTRASRKGKRKKDKKGRSNIRNWTLVSQL